MLPDFPKLKGQILRRLIAVYKMEVDASAPLVAQIRAVGQHEGEGGSFETEDGEIKQTTPETISVDVTRPSLSNPAFGPEVALQMLRDAAQEMARKKTKMLFSTLHETVEEVGNAIDAKGQPLTAELILKMWETILINFDEQGNPQMPTLVFNPIQEDRVKEQFRRLDTEPELIKRKQEIMTRQKLDWYDRESNRKLVD